MDGEPAGRESVGMGDHLKFELQCASGNWGGTHEGVVLRAVAEDRKVSEVVYISALWRAVGRERRRE